jgi:hypothetical protein
MKQPDFWSIDGAERERFYWDDWTLHRVHDSINEAEIMAENQAVRNNGGARNLGFGRPILQMSMAQYEFLQRLYPELNPRHGSAKERRARWLKIAKDLDYQNLRVS